AAKRFAVGGFDIAMMARDVDKLAPLKSEIEELGQTALAVRCDAGDENSIRDAFARVREQLGDPSVLIYNVGAFEMGGLLEVSAETFQHCWRVGAFGAFLAAQEVAPAMLERGEG